MSKGNLSWDEAKEIADFITGTENPDEDYAITENELCKKWNIDMEIFHEIANEIFKNIDFSVSPLTQKAYVGISNNEGWLAKKEIQSEFIGNVLIWLTNGKEIPAGKGCLREITIDGKTAFIIRVENANS